MNFWNQLINRIFKKKKEKRNLLEGLDEVKEKYDEVDGREEAIKEAAKIAIDYLKTHPDMPAVEFIKMIKEEEELPEEVLPKIAGKIPEIREEDIVIKLAREVNLPTEAYNKMIQAEDVSLDAAQKIAEQIPDKVAQKEERKRLEKIGRKRREEERKEKEKKIKKSLREKYATCDVIRGSDLIEEFKQIRSENESSEIYDMIKQVLARKAAIEWRRGGNTRIPSMTEVIPAEKMMEEDFPKLVGKEFEEIKDIKKYQGPKDYQYTEEALQRLILGEIAKQVAETYKKVGIIDIPQSERMRNLTEEQEEDFIQEIQKYGTDITNIAKIKKQIRGIRVDELEDLKELVGKIPEDEREDYIKSLKEQIQKGKKKPLSPEIEEKLEKIKQDLQGMEVEDVVEILDQMRDSIQDRKKEREEERTKELQGSTQSDDDEYTH